MKLKSIFLIAAAVVTLLAQDKTPVSRKPLDELTFYKRLALNTKIEALAEKYRIAEYRQQVQPLVDELERLKAELCASVGVPSDKIEGNCQVEDKASKESPTGLLMWIEQPKTKPETAPKVDSKVK